jgi:hypothetical protein
MGVFKTAIMQGLLLPSPVQRAVSEAVHVWAWSAVQGMEWYPLTCGDRGRSCLGLEGAFRT